MEASYHFTQHPLHLLDDLLATLSPGENSTNSINTIQDDNDESSQNNVAGSTMAMAEAKQDLVLRAADELFGSSLLENALALLDEQEQYQRNHCKKSGDNDDIPPMVPVIRMIRAKKSGRMAILVRKQRKKSSTSSGYKSKYAQGNSSSQTNTNNDKDGEKQHILDDYYLCLLGRGQIDRRALFANENGRSSKIHRQGAHCTCRSFFQNIKGGSRYNSSSKSNETSSSIPSSSCSSNVVVCKHLLAAILMPHLLPWSSKTGVVGDDYEIVEDRRFAKLVMRASIG